MHNPGYGGRSPGSSESRSSLDIFPAAEVDIGEPLGIAVRVGKDQMERGRACHSIDERKLTLLSVQLGGLQVEGRRFAPRAGGCCIEIEFAALTGWEPIFPAHEVLSTDLDLRAGPPHLANLDAAAVLRLAPSDLERDPVLESLGQERRIGRRGFGAGCAVTL